MAHSCTGNGLRILKQVTDALALVERYRLLVERLEDVWVWSPEDLVHDQMTRGVLEDEWATVEREGLSVEVRELDRRFIGSTTEHASWRSYAGRRSTAFWWRLPVRLGIEWHHLYLPELEAGLYEP